MSLLAINTVTRSASAQYSVAASQRESARRCTILRVQIQPTVPLLPTKEVKPQRPLDIPSSAVMETLAPELMHEIFKLVCNDGGFMGCSLSLVSRYVHDCAGPTRFQTVACKGAEQILAFERTLHSAPLYLRAVRHLFITASPEVTQSVNILSIILPWSRYRKEKIAHQDRVSTLQRAVHPGLYNILTATASTIVTLAIDFPGCSWGQTPFPPAMIALSELSIRHSLGGGALFRAEIVRLSSLPSLKRLILTGFDNLHEPYGLVESIKRVAPSLTHIGFSTGAHWQNREHMLHRLVPEMSGGEADLFGDKDTIFPRTLKCLLFEALAEDEEGSTEVQAEGDICVAEVARITSDAVQCDGGMERHWMARISGKDGFWDVGTKGQGAN